MKWLIKLLVLPVIGVVKGVTFILNTLTNLSAYVLSPLILFVLGCGIYCLVKARWMDVALLAGIELLIFGLMFGSVTLACVLEDVGRNLITFLKS